MKKFIEALKNDTAYDYIANNSHKLSKDELTQIIKDLLFNAYCDLDKELYLKLLNNCADTLTEALED